MRERKEAATPVEAQKEWVALFCRHKDLDEVDRRVLMALVDKVLVYEGHRKPDVKGNDAHSAPCTCISPPRGRVSEILIKKSQKGVFGQSGGQ